MPTLIQYEKDAQTKAIQAAIDNYKEWSMNGTLISLAMIFYVLTKFIFNTFATIKLPLDIWSKIDIFCAFTNILCFLFLQTITPAAVMDLRIKQWYNYANLVCILTIWCRFGGILFVI